MSPLVDYTHDVTRDTHQSQRDPSITRLYESCFHTISSTRVLVRTSRTYTGRTVFYTEYVVCASVYLLSALRSSKRRRALKKLRGRGFAELLPLGVTLETLAGLQMDSSLKVCKAASRCLARGFGCKAFRNKVRNALHNKSPKTLDRPCHFTMSF